MSERIQTILAGPCSKDSRYQLTILGEFGSREIKNIIKILSMQLEWASEDESAATEDADADAALKGGEA